MNDIDQGFRVGDRLFGWGCLVDDVADALGVARDEGRGSRWRRIEVACRPSWGLDTISVEMTAHGGDRPVTALKYELAAVPGDSTPAPDRWLETLASPLGAPARTEHYTLPAGAPAEGSVRYYASWTAGEQSVGLSLYGAPRAVDHGVAAGCLWLNWATEAAARPFVAEWRHRAAALAAEAEANSGIVSFVLSLPQAAGSDRQQDGDRDSRYALDAPQLLPTPEPIARRLGERGIGFWRSGDQRRWFASSRRDTISFELGTPVAVDWYDIKPAKGGGFSELSVDGWSVRDVHGSRAVRDAVAALETIRGVTIRRVDGYDC